MPGMVDDSRVVQEQGEVQGAPRAYFPAKFRPLFNPARYKVGRGGRGSGKSWSFARALVLGMYKKPERILCARELQNSIGESVHRLIQDQIFDLGLARSFVITDKSIRHVSGRGEFLFSGIRNNPTKIKSMEGIDKCWVEEAEVITERSWEILIPTIRKPGSEIWVTFNPDQEDDPSYKRFVTNMPPDCLMMEVNWMDNPYFPEELRKEKDYLYRIDPDAAEHVWGGKCRTNGAAQIFKGRFVIEAFSTQDVIERLLDGKPPRWFHGLDFGFSGDPSALIRCFTTGEAGVDEDLWIDKEAFGYGIEIDELPQFIRSRVDTVDRWPIKADASRPETISYLKRQGFNISAAEKWGGSVEDGITHLKGFRKMHIHSSLTHMREEARLYSYKVDRVTQEVLPIVADKHNHGWDALRYGLDGYIHRRGVDKIWAKLAGKKV
jgi:phage terminase large subunit